MKEIYLWLDDNRPAPEGWTHVTNVWDAIALIKTGNVVKASLDHDLGLCLCCEEAQKTRKVGNWRNCTCMTGYKLCLWMADNNKWPKEKPTVHSANPPGKFAMEALIERYWNSGDK